ncbi:hypothetical protein [Mesorhizobium loti]|jgi:hypothetical protein|uniref:Uncharacterized protein n=1 Tax=Rhizobium loti TaxID=381 RepID=A0A6M7U5T2_RHILI|nr:hypothetical protein [Mesorhizobium loti]OBQ72419.1 hypothetical protein A8145_06315 [Mesorhizobium loti]QKC71976.1 hypothetical protein EB815_24635 [Mesorhizobium loti]
MKTMRATEAEQPELFAEVRREMPAIHRAAAKMAKQLRGLSGVSQKQAIAEVTTCWIMALYPNDLKLALSLSDAIRDQVDINLQECWRTRDLQKQH